MILEILAVASAAVSAIGQIAGGNASRRAANASASEGDRLAEEALLRGEELARRYNIDLAQLIGKERTALAAQGLDLSDDSAAQVVAQTQATGAEEVAIIRENARREAFGLRRAGRNQAAALRAQAAGQYAGAFESVLDFGANAWEYRQRMRATTVNAPRADRFRGSTKAGGATYGTGYGPPTG